MKIKNSTSWSDHFLRRMTAWCCRQNGLPVRRVREAVFRNRPKGYSGTAYLGWGRIVVSTNTVDDLIVVTAHETAHLMLENERKHNTEPSTNWHERQVADAFQQNRDALLAEWSVEPNPRKPKPKRPVQEKRAVAAAAMLDKWRRKMKLARTKIQKYQKKVRYYERVAAKRSKSPRAPNSAQGALF